MSKVVQPPLQYAADITAWHVVAKPCSVGEVLQVDPVAATLKHSSHSQVAALASVVRLICCSDQLAIMSADHMTTVVCDVVAFDVQIVARYQHMYAADDEDSGW